MSRVIETARLVLRPWRVADADAALVIYADPTVRRWSALADMPLTAGDMALRLQQWRTDDLTSTGCIGPLGRRRWQYVGGRRCVGPRPRAGGARA
jgi:RimJ/RimL family protein N-acetyltransferase